MSRTRLTFLEFLLQKIIPAILLLGLGSGVFAALVLTKRQPDRETGTTQVLDVVTQQVQPYDGPIYVETHGIVVPHGEIILAAQVSGSIKTKHASCQAGTWVAKGTKLLTIDDQEYQIAFSSAQQEVAQAEVQTNELSNEIQNATELVEFARQDLALQQSNTERMRRLIKSISTAELEKAERDLIAAKNQLASQEHQLRLLQTREKRLQAAEELARLRRDKAKLDLDRTAIVAPSNGVVVSENFEVGSIVQPGTELLVFEDTTQADVEFNLRVDQLYWIMQDERASGSLPDSTSLDPASLRNSQAHQLPPIDQVSIQYSVEGETLTWQGRLDGFAGYEVDQQTRNIPCRVVVDDPLLNNRPGLGSLRRGMFVKVKVPIQPRTPMVCYPESALQANESVWAVRDGTLTSIESPIADRLSFDQVAPFLDTDPTSTASPSPSSTQVQRDHYWIISRESPEGLNGNDQVVISPLGAPFEGQTVRRVNEAGKPLVEDSSQQGEPPSTPSDASDQSESTETS